MRPVDFYSMSPRARMMMGLKGMSIPTNAIDVRHISGARLGMAPVPSLGTKTVTPVVTNSRTGFPALMAPASQTSPSTTGTVPSYQNAGVKNVGADPSAGGNSNIVQPQVNAGPGGSGSNIVGSDPSTPSNTGYASGNSVTSVPDAGNTSDWYGGSGDPGSGGSPTSVNVSVTGGGAATPGQTLAVTGAAATGTSSLMATLTQKVGPLPLWAWVLGVMGGGYYLWKKA